MMLALTWLTISLPFVYEAQKQNAFISTQNSSKPTQQDDNNNPLSTSTEEKVPSIPSEEYLHNAKEHSYSWVNALQHFTDHTLPVYIAYHGELLSPPPEA